VSDSLNFKEWLTEAEKYRSDRKLLPLLHLCNGWKISIQNSEGHHCLNGSGFEVLFREGFAPNYWNHMCEDPTDEYLKHLYVNVQFWMVEVVVRECGGALSVFEKEE